VGTRTATANAFTTFFAVVLAVGAAMPGRQLVFGVATPTQVVSTVAVAWIAYQISAVARAPVVVSDAISVGALHVLMFLSDLAGSPLALLVFAKSFAWSPPTPQSMRRSQAVLAISHAAVALAFLVRGAVGPAAILGLNYLASQAAYAMTARSLARAEEVRAERAAATDRLEDAMVRLARERIARELHDGVTSDVLAVLLRLRRADAAAPSERGRARVERAERILRDLRGLVRALRGESGARRELEGLVVAAFRAEGLALASAASTEELDDDVDPETALSALQAAHALAQACAGQFADAAISLAPGDGLELEVAYRGSPLSCAALAAAEAAFRDARIAAGAPPPGATFSQTWVDDAVRVRARLHALTG